VSAMTAPVTGDSSASRFGSRQKEGLQKSSRVPWGSRLTEETLSGSGRGEMEMRERGEQRRLGK
jgi:hypothetical protein